MKIKKAIAGLASAIAMLGCIHTSAAADQLRFGIDPTFPPFEASRHENEVRSCRKKQRNSNEKQ